MLSAPPAFILSQDRTLRSNGTGRLAPLLSECGSVRAGDPLILRTHEIHSRNIRDVPFLCGPGPLGGRSNSLVCLRRSHRSRYPVVKVRRADAPRKEIIYTIGGGPGAGIQRSTIPTQRPSRAGESQGARCVHAGIIPPGGAPRRPSGGEAQQRHRDRRRKTTAPRRRSRGEPPARIPASPAALQKTTLSWE